MPDGPRITCFDRREFLVRASVAALVLPAFLRASGAWAQDTPPAPPTNSASLPPAPVAPESFDDLYARLTKDAKPTDGKLTFDVPELAENGNVVPFTLSADSPMTRDAHIRTIRLMSTANPQPSIAVFHFTPDSGKAVVSGRMRLAKTQDIVALAETSAGELWVARTKITVTIGGCGG